MDDPNVVSPGILGFLAFFFLAVALYLLVRNMNGHLRRMGYRAAELGKQEELAREELAREELAREELAREQGPDQQQQEQEPGQQDQPPS